MAAKRFGELRTVTDDRWAVAVSVTSDVLNLAAALHVGAGIDAGAMQQRISMPMMGELDLSVALTITGVEITLSGDDGDRLRIAVRAAGSIGFGENSPMPPLPGRALVRAEVLVAPRIELRPDGRFVAQLDLGNAELVGVELEGIENSEADPGTLKAMGDMLFASVGSDVFSSMAGSMGPIGIELDAHTAQPLVDLGVRAAPADVVVGDGTLTVGLIAHDSVEGHADAPLRPGQSVVVAVASGSLTQAALRLAQHALGVPLPFEIDVETHSSEFATRIRNQRLTNNPFIPDLRPGVRTSIGARLVGDRIELSPREAWVELPLVPSFVNRINQAVGSLASLTPFKVSVPAQFDVPLGDGAGSVTIRAAELAMRPTGVSCVLEAVL